MKFCFCLITLSLICFVSAGSSEETTTFDITGNPENIEDFVFQGKETASKGPRLQISNGRQATNTQFPYVAELAINTATGGFLCTGSLIGRNWILTARHCIAGKTITSIRASLGSADRQGARTHIAVVSATYINAADGVNHPDIALFRLAQNAPITATIKTIRLPKMSKANFAYDNYQFTAIGWGLVSPGVFSRYLQYTFFKTLPKTSCLPVNTGIYYMCSKPPTGTSQLLGGDSGGPGVIVEADGIETQIGVNVAYVTSGTNIWQKTTRVSNFLTWIKTQTGISYV
ncbi:unnamed protein product [Chironomus riparius]|uniref:Peptidase S1 domain-containing protein n=1 Tax=Chironomus riparius TaxID=315576 RepID=A0A9N9RRK0_9DIPT|nr:unnamed protein product [Chironomus riparius]